MARKRMRARTPTSSPISRPKGPTYSPGSHRKSRGWGTRKWFPQGDFNWQEFSFDVITDSTPDNYDLMVLTESPTEALWVDDIRFEPVKVDQAKKAAVEGEIATQ